MLNLLGVDVRGWIADLWDQISAIPKGYLVGALFFQTLQTFFAGLSYYGILKFAYKDEVTLWPIIAAYAVGVAMNGFLPANIGTFVTLLMFVAIIPSCTVGGAIAAYIVQKIFFTIAGTFVYLYMFLSVPGAFDVSFGGNLKAYPLLTIGIVAGGAVLIMIVGRIFWSKVRALGAGQAGRRHPHAAEDVPLALVPAGVPLLDQQARRDRDLPRGLRHPGHLQLDHVGRRLGVARECRVVHAWRRRASRRRRTRSLWTHAATCRKSTPIDYSTAQQLITTAWNQIVALVLIVWVFGWTGGKQLVTTSYRDAKDQAADMKEQRAEKKAAKREAKRREGSETQQKSAE